MNIPIRVKAFDEHGIKLIPSTDADFNGLARSLIGRVADIGLKLKPMLVIVSNESPHTVVSYSKTWTARYAGGRTSVIRSHASFPETVCGDFLTAKDPEALPPGGKRVETASLVIQAYAQSEPYYDQFLDQFIVEKDQLLANAEELEIELGAVIFADGRLIGSDQDGWLSDLFSECVAEKQAWYREILSRLDSGASVDEAYAPIRAFQEQRNVRMHSGRPLDRAGVQLWKTQAAADAQRWRRTFTDAELPHLLKAQFVWNRSSFVGFLTAALDPFRDPTVRVGVRDGPTQQPDVLGDHRPRPSTVFGTGGVATSAFGICRHQ